MTALRSFRYGGISLLGQWLRYPQVQGKRAGPIRHRGVVHGETEQVTLLVKMQVNGMPGLELRTRANVLVEMDVVSKYPRILKYR